MSNSNSNSTARNDEVKIIEKFLKVISSKDSIDLKQLFSEFDSKEVNRVLESTIDEIFDLEKLKKRKFCPSQLMDLAKRLKKNDDLEPFFESLKLFYQHSLLSNVKYLVGIFLLKKYDIFDFLLKYFLKEFPKSSKKMKEEQIENLIKFYLNYKPSFAFVQLKKSNLLSMQIDMTREISDANSFLIDGLSLIVECYLSQKVDWTSGGQYLHFVHTFEKYIEMFSSLTDFYYIVFFRDSDHLLMHDRSFYLALNIIYNHWQNLKRDNAIKFFSSITDIKYAKFLEKEKPTFIVIDDSSLEQLNLNSEIKQDLNAVFDIFKIFYASQEIKFLFIKELSIKSNRLNGFYGSFEANKAKKFQKILEKLEYEKDLERLNEHELALRGKWKSFAKGLANDSSEEIKKIFSKLGAKMAFYCASLVWCYINNNRKVTDSQFGSLVFALIIHCYLQDHLDLKSRALRLETSKSGAFSSETKEFLDDFKGI
jgi:hypothetical protein